MMGAGGGAVRASLCASGSRGCPGKEGVLRLTTDLPRLRPRAGPPVWTRDMSLRSEVRGPRQPGSRAANSPRPQVRASVPIPAPPPNSGRGLGQTRPHLDSEGFGLLVLKGGGGVPLGPQCLGAGPEPGWEVLSGRGPGRPFSASRRLTLLSALCVCFPVSFFSKKSFPFPTASGDHRQTVAGTRERHGVASAAPRTPRPSRPPSPHPSEAGLDPMAPRRPQLGSAGTPGDTTRGSVEVGEDRETVSADGQLSSHNITL